MSERQDPRLSAVEGENEERVPGGDSGEYQEEMALAVDVFATRLQEAMLADLVEDKRDKALQGKSKPVPRRPRRMEKLLQGLFEYIDVRNFFSCLEALARDEAKEAQDEEELDEKGKGKQVEVFKEKR
ncbi:hypothetical protein CALCODRAFT_510916 [Calocera cornea HHB12733]|uniref:Uncharacterized protein n=1 Tax=Calocera cornea HHB12733 TaxID=1353952 RepID=A0A165E715_9BASI|nr:hypothetical protein CALCODRAFT_510916 [Calocera cornea HHB12733]